MARKIHKLTALAVSQAKRRGYYGDGGGLYLQVSASGAKSWVFRFSEGRKLREMGLGSLNTISLAEARQRAQECRKARLEGQDPIVDKHAKRAAAKLEAAMGMTFQACADQYIAAHKAGWRNPKHMKEWSRTLATYVYPLLGDLRVQAIDVGLVIKVLGPIWTTKPETAGRIRGRIESILDYAKAREWRTGENPARWRGHLENLLPRVAKVRRIKHYAALPYREMASFMCDLRNHETIAARALEFAILTTTRSGEVRGARWSEIDPVNGMWTIPASRMKVGKEHRVPLSVEALRIIERMAAIRSGDYVFPGGKAHSPLGDMALRRVLARMGRDDLTVHGFRSSFRDWAAERTTFPAEVAEMALAHTVGVSVEVAYRRGDLLEKRRQLAEAWTRYCAGEVSGEVIPLSAVV